MRGKADNMKNRINKHLVTFQNPFSLDSIEGEWPAGDYTIETEEEPLDSMAVLAFRRISTTLVIRPPAGRPGNTHFLTVDPSELDDALARDQQAIQRAENEGMVPS